MSNFTPQPGMLFYADCQRIFYRETGGPFSTVILKQKDRSYSTSIMKCLAVDDRSVTATVVYGDYGLKGPIFLLRKDFTFLPLGPGIAVSLGICDD